MPSPFPGVDPLKSFRQVTSAASDARNILRYAGEFSSEPRISSRSTCFGKGNACR
jgi:hypothetical protein